MQPLFLLCLLAAATGLPSQHGTPDWQTFGHLHREDYTFMRSLPQRRSARDIVGFKYVYVDSKGVSSQIRGPSGTQIEVAGSPKTSQQGMNVAANAVAKMTMFMPKSIFNQLAKSGSVGVFTAEEKLIVFPEYANLASGSCGTSCDGSCSGTCTFDGRKYEDIAGVGGERAVILEDNLLCTDQDPYGKGQNIFAHEFAHTIHNGGLSAATKKQIETAYKNAIAKRIWELTSYAASNDAEYFAEGVTAFLYVSQNNDSSGGMVYCDGRLCTSLQANRAHLRKKDPALYNILSYVFTDNRPNLDPGLTVCPTATVRG